jgi:hypothetical protein
MSEDSRDPLLQAPRDGAAGSAGVGRNQGFRLGFNEILSRSPLTSFTPFKKARKPHNDIVWAEHRHASPTDN